MSAACGSGSGPVQGFTEDDPYLTAEARGKLPERAGLASPHSGYAPTRLFNGRAPRCARELVF